MNSTCSKDHKLESLPDLTLSFLIARQNGAIQEDVATASATKDRTISYGLLDPTRGSVVEVLALPNLIALAAKIDVTQFHTL